VVRFDSTPFDAGVPLGGARGVVVRLQRANLRILHTQGATACLRQGGLWGKGWVRYQAGWLRIGA
jgi:hypothetical protein